MAGGVSVKMGVTGVAQFKQGMKESQAAVKNLDQQLKLNEAQLKLNGNEELALKNKTELLTKQIEEQKNVVKNAQSALEAMQRNGVSKTSVEFQKMQQNVYKASTDLMTMQAELQNVGESGEDAQSGVSHMNQALQRIGQNVSFQSVAEGLGNITSKMEAAAKAAWNLGKKIVQATLGGASWADELQTEASVWEITPEELYRMRETARIIDTDAETILQARKKLTTAMGKESNKETMGAFAALGIDPTGRHGDIEGVFWDAGQALMNMEDQVDRNEYAMRLFGKSFEELIPLFSAGREEYEKTFNKWDWIGDEQLDKLSELDDKYQELQSEWEAVQLQFQSQMAEVMTPVMETLTGLLKEFNTYIQSDEGQEVLASLGEAISGLFEDLTNIDPATVIGAIKDAIDGVKSGLEWIKNNKDAVKTALEVIAGGFALLKLGSLAANIGRIVSGLKGLGWFKGGSETGAPSASSAPSAESEAGAAAGGGKLAGLWNAMTSAVSNGAAALTMYDPTGLTALLPQVLADQTEFGRRLRNGAGIEEAANASWETIKASANEGLGNFAKYFTEDLPNAFWGAIGVTPEQFSNFFTRRDANADAAERLGTGADWRPSYQQGYGSNYYNPNMPGMDRMTNVAEEMNGGVHEMSHASEDMTGAAQNMMNLPDMLRTAVENAVISGMNSVTIVVDVNEVERRVGGSIGNQVIAMVR